VLVVFAFDVGAYFAARIVARIVLGSTAVLEWPAFSTMGPLAAPGAPASLVFPITLFAALLLTASYGRHRSAIAVSRIFSGVVVASAATAVTLATILGVRSAVLYAAGFGLIAFGVFAVGRVASEAFAIHVWPRDLGVIPAVELSGRGPQPLQARSWGDYGIVGTVEFGDVSEMPDVVRRLHEFAEQRGAEAVISRGLVPDEQLVPLIHEALDIGYRVIYPAGAIAIDGARPRILWHRGEPYFEVGTPVLRTSALFTKRVADVTWSLFLLITLAPLMAAIAGMIKLDSRGPAFFMQDRAGLGGRRFRMLKFRTMSEDADARKQELAHLNRSGDTRLFKIPSDPRVTRVGRFLRRWSLDELPQLVNVLRGEMSLVGPRPFFEADFAAYEDRHFRRLDTKPGITGLWQVSGRSDVVDFEDVIFLDRQYIEQWSIWLDLSILARTIPAVLRRNGAY
jgi:exopolysaccharide biosynthesis polyprenyl glycosylphosphotransferase